MESQKLENFFKLSDTKYTVGVCMAVVGFVLIWLGFSYNYIMMIVGIAVTIVGLFLLITGSIGRVGFETIDAERDKKLVGFGDTLTEDPHVYKRKSEHHESTVITSYDFEGEDLRSRHVKDGWRTSHCTAFRIDYLHDALALAYRSFSILDDQMTDEPHTECKYEDIDKAEIVRNNVKLTSGKDSTTVTCARLVITRKDGNIFLNAQVPDDIDSDNIASQINRFVEHGTVI